VVELPDEFIREVSERGFVPVAGGSPPVVMRTGAGTDGENAAQVG